MTENSIEYRIKTILNNEVLKGANLFIKTPTDFRVDKMREIFYQIFNALLHIVHFVRVINGCSEMSNKPHQTILIHWI